jgi:hypothetical protein
MKLLLIVSLMMLATSSAEKPIREGYAITYYSRDDASPGIVFEATTQRGLTISDTHDPKKLKAFLESCQKPAKSFYIKVYLDHFTATDTESNTTAIIASRNLVKIEWRK